MTAGLGPEQVAAARIGLAAAVLVVCIGIVRPSLLRVRAREWRLLLAYGLFAVAGVQLLYFVAASRIPVGVAILLEFTSPVLIAFWVRCVRRIRLPKLMWLGIALAMLGLAMVAQVWQGMRLDVIGVLAGLGAAVCSATYFLLGEHGVETRHPLSMVAWGMIIGAAAMFVVAPPWTLPTSVLWVPMEFGPWHLPVWLLLVMVAVVSTVLAYFAGISALRHLPASVASVLALLEPIVAAAAAWIFIDEALTGWQVLGACVLLSGATLVQLNSPGKRATSPAEPLPAAGHSPASGRVPS